MAIANRIEGEDLRLQMRRLGEAARQASAILALTPRADKDRTLRAAASSIRAHRQKILEANAKDMSEANKLSPALRDRLLLNDQRIEAMAKSLEDVADLPDPIGTVLAEWERPNGLKIARVRVPLGVIGIIYESRPNVTADASALCLKSGNAAILRSGSESFYSSTAILECMHEGLRAANLPESAVQLVPTRAREAVGIMLSMSDVIDIIIPRGGRSLIERVVAESRIPVIKHLEGICHVFVSAKADPEIARRVVVNSKMRRTGVCGAAETLLVAEGAKAILPAILEDLMAAGCEVRGDAATQKLDKHIIPAGEKDWDTEYLDAVIAVKIVKDVDEAIQHVNTHGSHHTDSIVTSDAAEAEKFLRQVDSGIVLHNASTQFADGGEFGMGAEIGISTGKLHARGPVGAEQLTSYKYVVRGNGQVRP
ncbi:MAG: glutamate-5-semialdehyde dehydrogenase [Alphaproteobacteria bacterium]